MTEFITKTEVTFNVAITSAWSDTNLWIVITLQSYISFVSCDIFPTGIIGNPQKYVISLKKMEINIWDLVPYTYTHTLNICMYDW